MIQETYVLVPAPSMLLFMWTDGSETKPWPILLVEGVVRKLLVGFWRSKLFDYSLNLAANRAEGLVFRKSREGRHCVGGKYRTSKYDTHIASVAISPIGCFVRLVEYPFRSVKNLLRKKIFNTI